MKVGWVRAFLRPISWVNPVALSQIRIAERLCPKSRLNDRGTEPCRGSDRVIHSKIYPLATASGSVPTAHHALMRQSNPRHDIAPKG
jgi:hypothetical protein